MKDTIAAIDQEAKYMQDSEDGHKQYRRGYVHALQTVSEFLIDQSEQRIHNGENAAVERLLAFAALHRSTQVDYPFLARPDSGIQRDVLEVAASALRSGDENADFLNWWLETYGTKAPSSSAHASCPIFPDCPAPRTEAELDSLEARFNRCYPEIVTVRRHRTCCHTPRG